MGSPEMLPQVFGRYLLVQRLSRGGMGEIFLARHGLSGFEKLCVIKKVLPHLSEDEQFISRFIDEAQVAIKLQHGNIAQVFEVGRVDDQYFLALEYIEGRDLRRTLSVLEERNQRFPVDLALLIARDVASGLSYAHRRVDDVGNSLRLVHCDISPPNVMVSFEGESKIIDFGIAKSAMRGTATDPKMGFGKFGYMAPEQLIRGGEVDLRTDIYAAGVIVYELLTGQRLYETSDTPDYRALARMVAKGQHPLPSQLDPALAPYDEIVRTALRPNLDDRFQSASDLRDAIQQALVGINPTISSEDLGSYMRGLFGDEMQEQRRAIAQAEATDLEPWVIELTSQSTHTVSYAMANMPLVAPEQLPAPGLPIRGHAHDRAQPHDHENHGAVSAADSSATQLVGREVYRPLRRPRRGVAIALVAAVLLVGGTVLAWVLGRDPGPASSPAVVDSRPLAGAPVSDDEEPAVEETIAMPPVPVDPSGTEEAAAGSPAPAADEPPVVRTRPRTRAKTPTKPKPKRAAPEPALTRADVQSRFRALTSEYKRFTKAYGPRLEREWADLAHYATYATSQDKLLVLDKRIAQFRSRMRNASN
jgi:serine/threonine protein kinase